MAPMRDGLDGENGLIGWQKQQARPSAHHYLTTSSLLLSATKATSKPARTASNFGDLSFEISAPHGLIKDEHVHAAG